MRWDYKVVHLSPLGKCHCKFIQTCLDGSFLSIMKKLCPKGSTCSEEIIK